MKTSNNKRFPASKIGFAPNLFPEVFPLGTTAQAVVKALWDRTTAPQSRGVLLLVMDLCKRAWSGSKPAKMFYREQQTLWIGLLMRFLPNHEAVEEVLQTFEGAILTFLITGDAARAGG